MINFLGDLKREHHHIKNKGVAGKSAKARYERAIFLYKPSLLGRSFWVPDSCGWKYLEPKDNTDMQATDKQAFDEIRDYVMSRTLGDRTFNAAYENEALAMAVSMNRNSGFMLMTGYSLVRCCHLLEIDINGAALAQLLMFIQDGLQEMGTMPLPEEEAELQIGDMTYTLEREGEVKKWDAPLTVTESELKSGVLGG